MHSWYLCFHKFHRCQNFDKMQMTFKVMTGSSSYTYHLWPGWKELYSALWRHLFDAGLSQAAPFTEKKGHAVADELSPRNAVIKRRC